MIKKDVKLKRGMHVGYTSGSHGDFGSNPLWGGRYGKIIGVIIDVKSDGNTIEVEFQDLGTKNTYRRKDLTLIGNLRMEEDEGEEPERRVQGLFNI